MLALANKSIPSMRLFTTSFFEGIPGVVIKLFTADTTAVAPFARDFCTFCNFMSAERAFSERLFHIGKLTRVSANLSHFWAPDSVSLFP